MRTRFLSSLSDRGTWNVLKLKCSDPLAQRALIPGAIIRSRLGAFTPAHAPLQAFSIVQFNRAVQPVEHEQTEPAPVKLASTWVKVPPVELDCSRRNMNSTASPRGGVEC